MFRKITIGLLILIVFVLSLFLYQNFNKIIPLSSVPIPLPEPRIKLISPIDQIVIEKNRHRMTVYNKGIALKTYRIALGFAPVGHKIQQGDGKTPEGTYYINYKNPHSRFYKSLKISYPSVDDKKFAHRQGLSPGGEIMIHGLAPAFAILGNKHTMRDWTLGCIAVTNDEIDEIYSLTKLGAIVIIKP